MRSETSIFGILLFTVTLHTTTFSFNIDTQYPIVINNNADGPDSYFGASIIFLKEEDTSAVSWLLIGSPRANSTAGLLQNVIEPGQVWRCSVGRTPEKCEVVLIDPKNIQNGTYKDRKDGGWLGGNLFSRGKRFVTCASRWSNKNANSINPNYHYYMNGQCYWRPKTDLIKDSIPSEVQDHYRLHPLRDKDKQSITTDEFYWMVGQAGFSTHISETGDLIMGAPGIDQWKGGFVRYYDSNAASLRQNGEFNEYGTFFQKHFISQPENDSFIKEKNSFFGYAVSSGKFIKPNSSDKRAIQFVGGGPRANSLQGQVVIFQFPDEATKKVELEIIQTIDGSQIGSYFGSVLCSVDINNDGYDDLLIGAPNYNTKLRLRKAGVLDAATEEVKPEQVQLGRMRLISEQFPGNGDEGAVFVYMSTGNSLILHGSLMGGNSAWSHFGSAIISLGDINKDGFKDVAVGSPYEDEHHGAVYIFHGTKDGILNEFSQVIKARSIDMNLRGFGYSLASEADIDNNGYNDVSIGAYASNQVVILRTRPLVKINAEIKTSVERLPFNETMFEFQSCISYSGFNAPPSSIFGVKITMDAEAMPPRVYIKLEESSILTYAYTAKTNQNHVHCEKFTAVVKINLAVTGKPIVIEQDVFLLDEDNTDQLPFTRTYALSRLGGGQNLQTSGPELNAFCKACPVRVKRKPFSFKLPLAVTCGSVDRCSSNLIMNASFVGIKERGSFIIGSAPSVILQVSIKNDGDPAFSPTIEISWRKRNLVKIPPNCQRKDDSVSTNMVSYQCSLGQILERNRMTEIEFEVDMKGMYAGSPDIENELIFDIKANTTSELIAPSTLLMSLLLTSESDIWMEGSKLDIAYNPLAEVIPPKKLARFEIFLDGTTALSKIWLDFQIPVNLTSGSKRVEIFQISLQATMDRIPLQCIIKNGGSFQHSVNSNSSSFDASLDVEMIEPSSVNHGQDHRNIRKRDTSSSNAAIKDGKRLTPDTTKDRKVLSLDCTKAHVECMRIHCIIENFNVRSIALVEFSMTTSSKTLNGLMKKHNVKAIHIHSYGNAQIIGIDPMNIQPSGHKLDEAYAKTIIKLETTDVPSWVYVISVVGGLVVLAGISLCFYALGYFERKKKPEENNDELEDDKEPEDEYESDDESIETNPLRAQTISEEDEEVFPSSPVETDQATENISFSRR